VGSGPRFWFQMQPDVKTVKNRLHLDVHASGGRAVARVRSESWLTPAIRARSSLVASSLPGAAV
jgi:hypothetical protein